MSERFIRRLAKWSGTGFQDDADWAEREILRLRDRLAAERERREDADEALTIAYMQGSADGKAERDALRAELAAACELLHKLTSIIPGNDIAGKEVADFLTALAKGGG